MAKGTAPVSGGGKVRKPADQKKDEAPRSGPSVQSSVRSSQARAVTDVTSTGHRPIVSSTKSVHATGAHVTTVVAGAHHAVSDEPERVVVEVHPGGALGVSFASGGVVSQVVPKGQAATIGVRVGWRLKEVSGASMRGPGEGTAAELLQSSEKTSAKEVLEALAVARKRGKPYTLVFLSGAALSGPRLAERGNEEGGSDEANNSCATGAAAKPDAMSSEEHGVTKVAKGLQLGIAPNDDHSQREQTGKGVVRKEATLDRSGGGNKGMDVSSEGGEERVEAEAEATAEEEEGRGDGHVTLIYEMYDEKFLIKKGSICAADIDETYCLSFVMPNCTIHLGPMSPSVRYNQEDAGHVVPYLSENPPGHFHGLVDGGVYWVYVTRDDEEEKKDKDRMKQVVQGMQDDASAAGGQPGERKDDGRNGLESCSCVYGNPCVDEYGCKDWHSRFAIAEANGWKGF